MGLTNPGVVRISASDSTYSGTVRITGGANITVGTDAQGITISGQSPAGGQFSGGVSNLGNTAGATGVSGTRMVLVGTNGITLSQTTDANGNTVSFSAGGGGGGLASAGFSTQGNTSGNTSMATSVMQLVGGNNITLSGGTAAGNVTITISAPNTTNFKTYSYFDPARDVEVVTGQIGQGTLHVQPLPNVPDVQYDRICFPVFNTYATNSTASVTVSAWFGLYTRNGSSISLYTSHSGTVTAIFSGTANSTLHSGPKVISIAGTGTLTQNDYWLGQITRTTTGNNNASISNYVWTQQGTNLSGLWNAANAASVGWHLGLGTYSATTSALPASIAFSQITQSGSVVRRAPRVWLLSGTA
jgi:hypothetical protein